MTITAKEVNELRLQTGAGIMDCKKALTEANGDMQAAIDYLRKKGAKVAELRAGRESNEGVVIAITSADSKEGVAVQISCETDFVAKNEDFVNFAKDIANFALENKIENKEALLAANMNGSSIQEQLQGKVAAIGEMIQVGAYTRVTGTCIAPYIHGGYKMGVLVCLNKEKTEDIYNIGRDVAMQIAAMNPLAVDADSVSPESVEREKNIIMDTMKADPKMEGKPEEMLSKIAEGKLGAFFKENTLLNQAFVKDNSKSVAQVLKDVAPDLTVTSFKRITLGTNA
jgi:elongation factor Ts